MKAVDMDLKVNGLPVQSVELRRDEMEDPSTFPILSYKSIGPVRVSFSVAADSPLRLLKPHDKVEVTWIGGGCTEGVVETIEVIGG